MNKKKFTILTVSFLFSLTCSCSRVPDIIEPKIDYGVQDRYLEKLPSPFSPLSEEQKKEPWGQEAVIAMGFAHDLELYQAITSFKRALYLLPDSEKKQKTFLDYEIFLCYYIGKRYEEAIRIYENTDLRFVDSTFAASHDLLVILFDSYTHMKETAKATRILSYLQLYYPKTAEKLMVATYLQEGNLPALKTVANDPSYDYIPPVIAQYERSKKSVVKAQVLNAMIPGAGYLYVGQKASAITAFLLNGLFIGASYYFFHAGNIPAGVIFAAFESGWYFGGIYGVGQEAKFYNERIYERSVSSVMNQKKLFPIFSLQYAF
jgi:tetratricopeptide (TPR) repeat protein